MSPGKVVPHRAIRAPLVVKMPFAILVEHSVRIVHPTILRSVMIGRTEDFPVFSVDDVREFHLAPADLILGVTAGCPVHRKVDEEFDVLSGPFAEIERDHVIHLVKGKTDADGTGKVIAADYLHRSFRSLLLDREEKVSGILRFRNTDESVSSCKMLDVESLCLESHGTEQQGCD